MCSSDSVAARVLIRQQVLSIERTWEHGLLLSLVVETLILGGGWLLASSVQFCEYGEVVAEMVS